MHANKICLASDNWSPAHPSILNAVVAANEGYASSYGADRWTEEAVELIQQIFQAECKVFIVPTGTGANVLGLMLCCHRHESVICSDIAHIHYQESGAFESIVGCKLLAVPQVDGKVRPEDVRKKLRSERAFGKHSTAPRVLSIAETTEVGTVYTLDELSALSKLCKEENLLFHIDGSRLYNAAASLGVELSKIVRAARPDVLSLGGTKVGLLGAEALLIFNPALRAPCEFLQKQTLQLLSKMRFASAQYIPLLREGLWHKLAMHANQKAKEIAAIIEALPQCSLNYPVESNQVFFTAPLAWLSQIQEKISCLLWDQEKNEIRFIASWCTSPQDVKAVQEIFSELAKIR